MILNCYLATALDLNPPPPKPCSLLTTYYLPPPLSIPPSSSSSSPSPSRTTILLLLPQRCFTFAFNRPDLNHVSCVSYPIVLFYFILLSVFNESLMFMHEVVGNVHPRFR